MWLSVLYLFSVKSNQLPHDSETPQWDGDDGDRDEDGDWDSDADADSSSG